RRRRHDVPALGVRARRYANRRRHRHAGRASRRELPPVAGRQARDGRRLLAAAASREPMIVRIAAWTLGLVVLVLVAINLWFAAHIFLSRRHPVRWTLFTAQ